jgi:hypothetical protein
VLLKSGSGNREAVPGETASLRSILVVQTLAQLVDVSGEILDACRLKQ